MRYACHLLLLASLFSAPELSAQIWSRYSVSLEQRLWSPLGGDAELLPVSGFIDPSTGQGDPDDGVGGPISIGFPVEFNGDIYTELYVGVDGWVSFEPPLPYFRSEYELRDPRTFFDSRGQMLMVAPLFGDHYLRQAGIDVTDPQGVPYTPGSIRISRRQSPTRDTFIVEWRDLNVNHLFDPADSANPDAPARRSFAGSVASFQLRIIEGDSTCGRMLHNASFEFHYTAADPAKVNPHGAAVGLKGAPSPPYHSPLFLNAFAFVETGDPASLTESDRLTNRFPPSGAPGSALRFGSNAATRNSAPVLSGRPALRCIDPNLGYVDTICVRDLDFACPELAENLTLTVLSPEWMTITPSRIPSGLGDICHPLELRAIITPDTGRVTVSVMVYDRWGAYDTLSYVVSVSEPTRFEMPVRIRNTRSEGEGYASQELVFGMARNATSGQEAQILGRLDSNYCEYELPPVPPRPIFDARWVIPTRTGIIRNIHPENSSAGEGYKAWMGLIQPGSSEDDPNPVSLHYPLVVSWAKTDAMRMPERHDLDIMDPLQGAIFRVDMRDPRSEDLKLPANGSVTLRLDGDTVHLELHESSGLTAFHIRTDVDAPNRYDEPAALLAGYRLSAGSPNPFSSTTGIMFAVPKRTRLTLELFDVNGERVRTLFDRVAEAGEHLVGWDGRDAENRPLPSGTYFCRLSTDDARLSRAIVLVR